jgi:hypothetical protein
MNALLQTTTLSATTRSSERPTNGLAELYAGFSAIARTQAAQRAFICDEGIYTYGDLARRVQQFSLAIRFPAEPRPCSYFGT